MNILNILLGLVILLTGRQLFWLFLAILGFLAGANLAQEFINTDPAWMVWLLAIILGIIGAFLAVFLQRVAAAISGFVAGWVFMSNLAATFGWDLGDLTWILFVIGGVVGAVLINIIYDGALIFLSSLAGATTIMQNLNLGLDPLVTTAALVILVLVGVSVQYRAYLVEQGSVTA